MWPPISIENYSASPNVTSILFSAAVNPVTVNVLAVILFTEPPFNLYDLASLPAAGIHVTVTEPVVLATLNTPAGLVVPPTPEVIINLIV